MMRRSPMPKKRTTPRRQGAKAPRIKPGKVEDPAYLAKVRALPCLACQMDGVEQVYRTEAHHIRRDTRTTTYGKGQKAPDTEAIPLCMNHHWNGAYGQTIGLTLRWFESRYGNERDLMARTRAALGLGVAA